MSGDRDPRARALFWRWYLAAVLAAILVGAVLALAEGRPAPVAEPRASHAVCPGLHCPVETIRDVPPEVIRALVAQLPVVGASRHTRALAVWSATVCVIFLPPAAPADLEAHERRHCREGHWHE